MVVTIDGPAGAGKSTVSKSLAQKLGFLYLDTGALYRALAYALREEQVNFEEERELLSFLGEITIELFRKDMGLGVRVRGEEVEDKIRSEEIGALASRISKIPAVRERLLPVQRQASDMGDIIAEGRDMGTVVFPWAEVKFFLDASVEERVRRRVRELIMRGEKEVDQNAIAESIIKRDRQDMERGIAPLKPHPEAIIIDTSYLSVEEVVKNMLSYIKMLRRAD
ncbi:MAG: (d)CMP kinase [Syntrophales bacterium]|nr:(d)CMP kinase [Syntrophales bacterium]